jgi:N utilization substance protein B
VKRSEQRRQAVFALYQQDLTQRPLDELLGRDARPFTKALAHAVEDNVEELDALIERHATGWTLDRIAPLEKAILRVALLEIAFADTVHETELPVEAAIDEAVETAKVYCGADAPGFVNGILGAAVRQNAPGS